MITIMSSLAQEESRSISENCTWGQRKRFADGKGSVAFATFLGYDRGPNGEFVINEEQAAIVRRIYKMFLEGASYYKIATTFTNEGIPTPAGKTKWTQGTVKRILTNEKYKGDILLQKTFTTSYLTKKIKVNEGEVPQYYVEEHHPAIIPPETFDLAQEEVRRRSENHIQKSSVHPFSGKVRCGECGSLYGSKVWHSTDKYRHIVWQCNRKYSGDKCRTPALSDEDLKAAFVSAANRLLKDKDEVIANGREMEALLFDTKSKEEELSSIRAEMAEVAATVERLIKENSHVALDQEEYGKKYDELAARYDALKEKADAVERKIKDTKGKRGAVSAFLDAYEKTEPLTGFSLDAFNRLCDFITVYTKEDIRVTFKNGQEVRG